MHDINVDIKFLDPRWGSEWEVPKKATDGAAAIDLRAAIKEDLVINTRAQLISTGLAIHIKNPGVAAIILPRSGKGHRQGLVLGNGTGLIDSDYQGELFVSAVSRKNEPNVPVLIKPGERIAQLLFIPVLNPIFHTVTEFNQKSLRGEGGFGHTG